jgi:hypothetical protein
MNRQFLSGWEVRTLTDSLREVSATWRIDIPPRLDSHAVSKPRLETAEERALTLRAIAATLNSIRKQIPNCLAIVGVDAISNLDQRSKELLLALPHVEAEFEWLPGDEDFAAGDRRRSRLIAFGKMELEPVFSFFHGIDLRCVVLFSLTPLAPSVVAKRLAHQGDHLSALQSVLGPDILGAYPALDGDVLALVAADEGLMSRVVWEGDQGAPVRSDFC